MRNEQMVWSGALWLLVATASCEGDGAGGAKVGCIEHNISDGDSECVGCFGANLRSECRTKSRCSQADAKTIESCPIGNFPFHCDAPDETTFYERWTTCVKQCESRDLGCAETKVDGQAPQFATKTIGPEGGTITLGTLRLVVPPDALSEESEISVEALPGGAPEAAISLAYEFLPHGLWFNLQAELRLPIEGEPEQVTLVTGSEPLAERIDAELGDVRGESVAVGQIEHFSTYYATSDAPEGSYCVGQFDGVPDQFCTLQDRSDDGLVAWAINEQAPSLLKPDAQPYTLVAFRNLSKELVIVESFKVENGMNVTTLVESEGERFEDHTVPRPFDTGGIRVLRPTNAPSEAFKDAINASNEPMKSWWRFADLSRWIVPDDETLPMSYDFCLGYRIADAATEEAKEVCGHYEGHAGDVVEPSKRRCGESCTSISGECEEGLMCFGSFSGEPCSEEPCLGYCATPTCDATQPECQTCDDLLGCSGASCILGMCNDLHETCDQNGCCVPCPGGGTTCVLTCSGAGEVCEDGCCIPDGGGGTGGTGGGGTGGTSSGLVEVWAWAAATRSDTVVTVGDIIVMEMNQGTNAFRICEFVESFAVSAVSVGQPCRDVSAGNGVFDGVMASHDADHNAVQTGPCDTENNNLMSVYYQSPIPYSRDGADIILTNPTGPLRDGRHLPLQASSLSERPQAGTGGAFDFRSTWGEILDFCQIPRPGT